MLSILGFADPISSWMHLLGAVVFAVLGAVLVSRARGNPQRQALLIVYAVCCVFTLSVSGVYHLLPRGGERSVMLRLDHSAIFALIAGTFTSVQGILCRGWMRWVPMIVMWVAAVVGITLKLLFLTSLPGWFWVALYIIPSWVIGSPVLWVLVSKHGVRCLSLLIWGGVAYTIGAIFNKMGPPIVPGVFGPHEMWHVLVLVGMGLHWKFIYDFAQIDMQDIATTRVIAQPSVLS